MGTLFGKPAPKVTKEPVKPKPKAEVSEKDRAILDLKNSRDRLKKYRKKLDVDAAKLTEQAKQLIAQNQKDRALLVLKLRRFREKELNSVDAQLISVLEMIGNVEWEYSNMEVLKALKTGTAALNAIHQEMSVEEVQNILDETNEAIEIENEINALLIGQLSSEDDEELQAELAMLMGESSSISKSESKSSEKDSTSTPIISSPAVEHYPNVPTVPVMPTVPADTIISSTSSESEKQEDVASNNDNVAEERQAVSA